MKYLSKFDSKGTRIASYPIDGSMTAETIESQEYSPLSRPLFTYVKNEAMKDNEAAYDFIHYLLENAGEMAGVVGYVSLPQEKYDEEIAKLEALK